MQREVALTNSINNLQPTNNVALTISNPTVTGGTITNANISGTTLSAGATTLGNTTIGGGLTLTGGATFDSATTTNFAALGTSYFAGKVGIGTTSPFTNLAVVGNGYLSGSLNVGDAATTRSNLGLGFASNASIRNAENLLRIAAWGDSLTGGTGGNGTTYPADLSALSGYASFNGGVYGQTSTQIAARMLAASNMYVWPTIIWAGRNNYSNPSQVETDIASMVAALQSVGNNSYIILSVLNGPSEPSGSPSYNQISSINTSLAATYGSHYLDVRTYLVQSGLSVAGIATSTQDQTDYNNDVPETDLRSDAVVHLNSAGYAIVAQYIYQNFNVLANTVDSHLLTDQNIGSLLDPSNGYQQGGVTILTASTTNYAVSVGQYAGVALLPTGLDNTSVGYQALTSATSSSYNTAVGYQALTLNATGSYNTAIGYQALNENTYGLEDTATGYQALYFNTTGGNNTANGVNALRNNTTGGSNVALGTNSLYSNTTGGNNAATGYQSLYFNTTGVDNVANGYWSLFAATSTIGTTAIGYQSGRLMSGATGAVGNYNTLIGYNSGYDITTGGNNLILGTEQTTATGITTGSNNILLGNSVRAGLNQTGSNQLNIGNMIFGTSMGIGATLGTGLVGIGTTSPLAKLDVAGGNNATVPLFQLSSVASYATTTEFIVNNNGTAWLAGALTQNSDQRLKTNITNLDASSSLAAINALNPVTFTWLDPLSGVTPQLGFIAQQVQSVFPNLVSTTSATALTPDGTLGLNYIGLIAPLVRAVQALSATVSGFALNFVSAHITVTTMDAGTANINTANVQNLCMGSVCITPAQFEAVFGNSSQSSGGGGGGAAAVQTSASNNTQDSSSTNQTSGGSTAPDSSTTPSTSFDTSADTGTTDTSTADASGSTTLTTGTTAQ